MLVGSPSLSLGNMLASSVRLERHILLFPESYGAAAIQHYPSCPQAAWNNVMKILFLALVTMGRGGEPCCILHGS
jgi:hypothetical protein